jgi:dATP/dGTP diphosphohydrolase, N-terminal
MAKRDDSNPKDRLGVKKVPLRFVPMVGLIWESLAFAEGASRYGEFNWRNRRVRRSVYCEAILRHTIALIAGEDIDPDSGLPHEAKIRACCAIMLDAAQTGDMIDDRFEKDMAARLLKQLTAGDYHAAGAKITRTPARTLDEVRAALERVRAADRRKQSRRAAHGRRGAAQRSASRRARQIA